MRSIRRAPRIFILLLVIVLSFTMIVNADAGDSGQALKNGATVGDGIEVDGLTYLITSIDGLNGTVELSGYSVEPSGVLNIPQSIEHDNAVYNITSIGEDAFDYCSKITEVIIPEGVTIIKDFAFGQCWGIVSVGFPETLVTIYDRVFCRCNKIQSISLPQSLKKIGASAFLGCDSLSEVVIPASVTSIGNRAFSECESLLSITVSDDNTKYSSQDGVLFDKAGKTLICYPAGLSGCYNVPSGVETIQEYAFYHNEWLVGVYIPDTVEKINSSAFAYCARLSEVRIPTSITKIDYYAFDDCSKLSDVQYSGSNEQWNNISISKYGNDNLISNVSFNCINEPFIDSTVGERFSYGNLKYLVLTDEEPYGTLELLGYDVEPSGELMLPETITYKGKEYVIKLIGDSAFGWCSGLTKVVMPDSVEAIEHFAFGQCWKLKEVQLPDGLKTIGESAFVRDSVLETITIPEGVVTIGESAFMGCDVITEFTIPESVETIGRSAFAECESLLRFVVAEDNANYSAVDGILFNKARTQLICYPCNKSGNYTVPDGVTEIGYKGFAYCKKLLNVVIPKSVKVIDNYAFYYCTGLNSVVIGKNVNSIGYSAFGGCKYLSAARYLGTEEEWGNVSLDENNTYLTDVLEFGCNHNYTNPETTKQATCTETGEMTSYCTICGDSKVEVIPLHSQTIVVDEAKDPTCTEDGLTEGSHCSACNEVIIAQESIAALGHDYSEEFTVDAAPTCTEGGSKSRHCTRCEEVTDVTPIDALGHDWDDGAITVEPTCTDVGVNTFTCSRCKETRPEEVEALGHEFASEFTIDVNPTCTEEGSKSRHCTRCEEVTDVTPIAATGHIFGDWEDITPNTCEDAGVRQRNCTVCEFTESEDTDPKGHDIADDFTIDIPATCTADGSQSRHCSRCETVFDSEIIPATGHAWNAKPTIDKPATCTEDGSQSTHCAKCSETKDTEVITALGHNWKAPTYTWSKDNKTVTATRVCSRDGSHKETEKVSTSSKVTTPATYSSAGKTTYTATFKNKAFTTQTKTVADIPILAPVKLSSVSAKAVTYTGAEQKPAVTVKDANGKTVSASNYTVKYSKNIAVGTATATVTAKANSGYTGTVKTTFKINKAKTVWKRLSGNTALDTMKVITGEFGTANVAVVTTNGDFKDALSAAPLAGSLNAPVFTTTPGSLSEQTKSELRRMGVKTVYILGSIKEVSNQVKTQIEALGIRAVRYTANSPSGRAVSAASKTKNPSDTVIIATQKSFKDALSISPYAYASKSPILYAEDNLKLSDATIKHIRSGGYKKAIIVGGPLAIPAAVEAQLSSAGIKANSITRLAGTTSYNTSLVIAQWALGELKNGTNKKAGELYTYVDIKFQPVVKMGADRVGVATGQNWKDALAGSALCGKNKAILLLEDSTNYNNTQFTKAHKNTILKAYVFGGPFAVSEKVYTACENSTK